ncbi:MAG: response regulator [Anaerolineae bacterium]|nr:response regulator [Anaerolineae bacterium]
MNQFFDYLLTVLANFGGGAGGPQNDLVRFGMTAIFFAILLYVAWSRQQQSDYPREKWLVWGFGLGLGRELFMFIIVSLIVAGMIEQAKLEIFFPPFEHVLRSVAVVYIAGAFLRYILKDALISRRYLQVWLSVTIACYLIIFWPWAQAVMHNPALRFGMHWGDWVFRIVGVISLAIPIVLLAQGKGWVRNVAIIAIAGFFLDDFLMLFNLATAEIYAEVYSPIRHNLHIWSVALLGYVYFKEQANELKQSKNALQAYSEQLEEMVETRTAALTQRTEQLEQQTIELAKAKELAEMARAEAEVANQAKSQFLSNMSHELRTPLNGILGYAQILNRDPNLTTTQRDGLNIIYNSGQHLLTLINDVLDLAKVEANKLELSPAPLDLPTFLDNVVALMDMSAQQKGLRFIFQAAPNMPHLIEADEKRLRQVLLNLLGNAIKFTETGQVVLRVASREAGGGAQEQDEPPLLRFEVEDTGPGIPPTYLQKIFQPFEQIGDSQQRLSGTGLGLVISQQLVRLMGGQIQVSSPPPPPITIRDRNESTPTTGSLFWFEARFPVAEAVEPMELPAQPITGYKGPRRRVLVVDDKSNNRLVLLNLLELLGFEVVMAENGQEGLDQARQTRPDLILMDLVMPVMMGFEAISALRATPELAAIPIIAVSASALDLDQDQNRRIGCDDFLAKPVEADKLYELIGHYLDLEWIYEDKRLDTPQPIHPQSAAPAEITPPPQAELEMLYELARLGSMRGIQERAYDLENLSERYHPFAQTLHTLTEALEDKKIITFLEQYLNDANG